MQGRHTSGQEDRARKEGLGSRQRVLGSRTLFRQADWDHRQVDKDHTGISSKFSLGLGRINSRQPFWKFWAARRIRAESPNLIFV